MKPLVEVFSSGGGTQSTAIAALIIQGRLPKPDYIVIADTGRETETTWSYLDAVVRPALADIGLTVHRIGPEWQSMPAHEKNWLTHNGNTVLIPGWSNVNDGKVGKLPGFCSAKWKVKVVDRWLSKECSITRSKYRKWIGFSLDEYRRATRIMAGEEGQKDLIRLPLVNDVPLRRNEAIQLVKDMGWPEPPRSRCWMCPNQGNEEWLDLKLNHHDEFAEAVKFEQEVQARDCFLWLHKAGTPLDTVPLGESCETPDYCSNGMCFI